MLHSFFGASTSLPDRGFEPCSPRHVPQELEASINECARLKARSVGLDLGALGKTFSYPAFSLFI